MDTVEIQRIPEGESGEAKGRLTQTVLESMASYFAIPEPIRRQRFGADDVAFLADRLGVTRGFVRKSQRDRRLVSSLRERVNQAVVFMMPAIIHRQAILAFEKDDTRAARLLLEIAGFIKQAGVSVNLNQQIGGLHVHHRDGGQDEDRENLLWLREMLESGNAQKMVEAAFHVEAVAGAETASP